RPNKLVTNFQALITMAFCSPYHKYLFLRETNHIPVPPLLTSLDNFNADFNSGDRCLILVKYFDERRDVLVYAGSLIVARSMHLWQLLLPIGEMLLERRMV